MGSFFAISVPWLIHVDLHFTAAGRYGQSWSLETSGLCKGRVLFSLAETLKNARIFWVNLGLAVSGDRAIIFSDWGMSNVQCPIMWVNQCHFYHPGLGMVEKPAINLW